MESGGSDVRSRQGAASLSRRRLLKGSAAGLVAAGTVSRGLRVQAMGQNMNNDTITGLDATALSRAIAAREISCMEVMQAYLQQRPTRVAA